MSTDKTLADVQPGGRVRLGDQAERARFEEWARGQLLIARSGNISPSGQIAWTAWQAALATNPCPTSQGDALRDVANAIWLIRREQEDRCDIDLDKLCADHPVWAEARAAISALSAQPSPGGQDALDTLIDQWMARADRHEASALEADSIGGMQMAVAVHEARAAELNAAVHSLKEALAARQPVRHVRLPQSDLDLINEAVARQPVGELPVGFVLYEQQDKLVLLQGSWETDERWFWPEREQAQAAADRLHESHGFPNNYWRVTPVSAAPPAQAVDLGQFIALAKFGEEFAFSAEKQPHSRVVYSQASRLLALIESKAAGK